MRLTESRPKSRSGLCRTQAQEAPQPGGRWQTPPPPSAAAVTPTRVCCRHFFLSSGASATCWRSGMRSACWLPMGLPPFTHQVPHPGMLLGSLAVYWPTGRSSADQWGRRPYAPPFSSSMFPTLLCSCAVFPLNGGEDEPLWPGSKPEQDLGPPKSPAPGPRQETKPAQKGSLRCQAVAPQPPPLLPPPSFSRLRPPALSETRCRCKLKARA